jgi:hypothetical protein
MLVSILIDPIMSLLRTRFGVKPYQQLEWRTNDAMQLQRLAHEELGFGTWTDVANVVPVTRNGELLSSLDISDPKHPKLQVSPLAINHNDQAREKIAVRVQGIEIQSPTPDSSPPGTSPTTGSPVSAFGDQRGPVRQSSTTQPRPGGGEISPSTVPDNND